MCVVDAATHEHIHDPATGKRAQCAKHASVDCQCCADLKRRPMELPTIEGGCPAANRKRHQANRRKAPEVANQEPALCTHEPEQLAARGSLCGSGPTSGPG